MLSACDIEHEIGHCHDIGLGNKEGFGIWQEALPCSLVHKRVQGVFGLVLKESKAGGPLFDVRSGVVLLASRVEVESG